MGEEWGRRGFIMAACAFCLSYGVIAGLFGFWPAGIFKNASLGLKVLISGPAEKRVGGWFEEPRTDKTGVLRHDPDKVYRGVTAFSIETEPRIYLIDMGGKVLHQWFLSQSFLKGEIGYRGSALLRANFDRFRVSPDGGLLAVLGTYRSEEYGGALVMLDRDSNVVWHTKGNFHHDFDVGEDGRVYALTHRIESLSSSVSPPLAGKVSSDYINVLSPDGEIEERIGLVECLTNSRYGEYLERREIFGTRGDITHTNAIQLVSHEQWNIVPDNGNRHVLISMRNVSFLAIVDIDDKKVVRLIPGPWRMQHDANLLPNGHLMVFDNWGGDRSRVLEIDTRTNELVWQFPSSPDETLDSKYRGSHQRLENGNTLITEANGARIIETTSTGEVVWEYRLPLRVGKDGEHVPIVSWAQRYPF